MSQAPHLSKIVMRRWLPAPQALCLKPETSWLTLDSYANIGWSFDYSVYDEQARIWKKEKPNCKVVKIRIEDLELDIDDYKFRIIATPINAPGGKVNPYHCDLVMYKDDKQIPGPVSKDHQKILNSFRMKILKLNSQFFEIIQ